MTSLVPLLVEFLEQVPPGALERLLPALDSGALHRESSLVAITDIGHLPARSVQALRDVLVRAHELGYRPEELALAIRTVEAMKSSCTSRSDAMSEARLVYTVPGEVRLEGLRTVDAMNGLLAAAQRDIVVLGYMFTPGARHVVDMLARARQRGVEVVIIGNSRSELCNVARMWPDAQRRPALYSFSVGEAEPGQMHAKTTIVDGQKMLVTSANFTLWGLQHNVEMGLLVTGPVCHQARELVAQLVQSGLLKPVESFQQ